MASTTTPRYVFSVVIPMPPVPPAHGGRRHVGHVGHCGAVKSSLAR
jgi:hypothetical protein